LSSQEEETSVQTETISVEKLRQRFDSGRRDEEKSRRDSNPRPAIKTKPSNLVLEVSGADSSD
jgi:hypothetical protein